MAWIRPSDADPDRLPIEEPVSLEPDEVPEATVAVGAGRVRGLLLHKLMEEVLCGECTTAVKL